ncbi:60S ribosomal protein L36 [Pseudoloma neurophilia]|uniref:60S ribosomal protein L36 n=1 Tax=Pseudoloma neurophilia TaxID=146866 RepID=A0A0R0M491_9MICR|nr:60S ribosomal protein L36 [Pseudoloma neurophilia]
MILNQKARALKHKVVKLNLKKKDKSALFKPSENKLLARSIVSEICGKAPYELMAISYLKKGNDKKCKKFLRKRLGSLKAAKKKMDILS